MQLDRNSRPKLNQIGVVTVGPEEAIEGLVATTKCTVDGAPVAKQARTYGTIDMTALLDLDSLHPGIAGKSVKTSQRSVLRTNKPATRKHTSIIKPQEHAGKYNVMEELANASTGLEFEQLSRTDAENDK